MRQVTVYTTDKEYRHFVELVKNLLYVKRIETDEEPATNDALDNLKAGLQRVRLFQKGQIKNHICQEFFE